MKYNRWDDIMVDTDLFLQLQDLATVFSGIPDIKFEYAYGSFIDLKANKITGGKLWDVPEPTIRRSGYKTDIFLRTIGSLHYSSLSAFRSFWKNVEEANLDKFATQLITLLEDLRLEERIKQDRPGSAKDFAIRKSYLKHYFTTQLATNITRSYATDELFCMIYLLLQADGPDPAFPQANRRQLEQLEELKPHLYATFEAKSTVDIVRIATTIVWKLSDKYKDSLNIYFTFPLSEWKDYERNTLFDELTRTDDVANDDREEVDPEKNEYMDETFSTWHRENQNADRKQTFLQFDLDVGTKTNLQGGGARETEDADQAMGAVQGSAGKSEQNDYSSLDALEKQTAQQHKNQNGAPYGEENRNAVAMIKNAAAPTFADVTRYQTFVRDIESHKRKLANTIEKVLEHKKIMPRKDLIYGRLSKNLLPIVTEEYPRLFYKKDQDAKEIDAVFTLLVDCSASMHQKMDETKKGIVLFHEVLDHLKIPHTIVGFWEDATAVKEYYQPNHFHVVHAFTDSFYQNTGAKIMQLEPEEDNRDGFSIRVMTEKLLTRQEKHKFLLVFSDGEPAAANYDQNGIVDTHVAVSEARKKGIDVIGMFLSDGAIDEREDETMKNIYGRERLMIPDVSELPERFSPILKKLLLRSI
ncbi:VWA domain-containing protein [Virgibacillus sp. 179-BFC.A HS]|uniref:VWA domain-containing protein n=1 Tax=Tigheibacillus jepli TaxID=3035914 RepID=A0ABU5CII5_9BACI|nr:VWA domain-containing protein [Virgibacillus sp. 179-BFC.A HS]MDY0406143.1 VWA domain-containing protein [Virgibacillus sp. 179-BFC.A HS]